MKNKIEVLKAVYESIEKRFEILNIYPDSKEDIDELGGYFAALNDMGFITSAELINAYDSQASDYNITKFVIKEAPTVATDKGKKINSTPVYHAFADLAKINLAFEDDTEIIFISISPFFRIPALQSRSIYYRRNGKIIQQYSTEMR